MTFEGVLRNAWILNHRLSLHLHLGRIYIVSVSGTSASRLFTEIQSHAIVARDMLFLHTDAQLEARFHLCAPSHSSDNRRRSRDYFLVYQLAYTKFLELRCILETCVSPPHDPGATPFTQPFMLQTAHAGVPVSCLLSPPGCQQISLPPRLPKLVFLEPF